jgi:hypothetical protein
MAKPPRAGKAAPPKENSGNNVASGSTPKVSLKLNQSASKAETSAVATASTPVTKATKNPKGRSSGALEALQSMHNSASGSRAGINLNQLGGATLHKKPDNHPIPLLSSTRMAKDVVSSDTEDDELPTIEELLTAPRPTARAVAQKNDGRIPQPTGATVILGKRPTTVPEDADSSFFKRFKPNPVSSPPRHDPPSEPPSSSPQPSEPDSSTLVVIRRPPSPSDCADDAVILTSTPPSTPPRTPLFRDPSEESSRSSVGLVACVERIVGEDTADTAAAAARLQDYFDWIDENVDIMDD